jgi:hypothetical protein
MRACGRRVAAALDAFGGADQRGDAPPAVLQMTTRNCVVYFCCALSKPPLAVSRSKTVCGLGVGRERSRQPQGHSCGAIMSCLDVGVVHHTSAGCAFLRRTVNPFQFLGTAMSAVRCRGSALCKWAHVVEQVDEFVLGCRGAEAQHSTAVSIVGTQGLAACPHAACGLCSVCVQPPVAMLTVYHFWPFNAPHVVSCRQMIRTFSMGSDRCPVAVARCIDIMRAWHRPCGGVRE